MFHNPKDCSEAVLVVTGDSGRHATASRSPTRYGDLTGNMQVADEEGRLLIDRSRSFQGLCHGIFEMQAKSSPELSTRRSMCCSGGVVRLVAPNAVARLVVEVRKKWKGEVK